MGVWRWLKSRFVSSENIGINDPLHPRFYDHPTYARRLTTAGEWVGHDSAMALATYYACLRNLSEDVAKLPFGVFRRLEPRGREPMPDHPVHKLLHDEPNSEMCSLTFREMLTHWGLGWGNGYAEIVRTGAGIPMELLPIHPSRVDIKRNDAGEIRYFVRAGDGMIGETVVLLPRNIFHLRGLGNDLAGYSLVRFAAESLGLSLAAQTFGAAFFGNGANMTTVFKHPKLLSDKAHQHLKTSLKETHVGPYQAFEPYIAEEGMDVERLGIPPEEAQFLETRELQVEEVARWCRMPLQKLYHHKRAQGWSTLEVLNTDYVVDTLMPWTLRWEQEAKRKLFLRSETDLFAKHKFIGLLRGDSAARSAYYTARFNIGTLSQNDIRELEDENPIEGGDEYFVPMNMVPMSKLDDETDSEAETVQPDAPDTTNESETEEDARRDRIRVLKLAHARVFADVYARLLRKEERAVLRHAGKASFGVWYESFHVELGKECSASLKPSVEALAVLVCEVYGCFPVDVHESIAMDSVLVDLTSRHLKWSSSDLRENSDPADVMKKWQTRRAPEAARIATDLIADRMIEAIQERSNAHQT